MFYFWLFLSKMNLFYVAVLFVSLCKVFLFMKKLSFGFVEAVLTLDKFKLSILSMQCWH